MRCRPLSVGLSLALLAAAPALALELPMSSVQFPERKTVELGFLARPGAPQARLSARVTYREAQARIELAFDSMKPAVLFGGDVTSYVLWAVTRDGRTENLGELVVRERKGSFEYSTGLKEFALLVTAEAYYLVSRPSELVMFVNAPVEQKRVDTAAFRFSSFDAAPRHAMDTIAHIAWDSTVPIDLIQADKAYELASRRQAEKYAPEAYREAGEALAQAKELQHKDKKLLDYTRRSVALSNVAINIATRSLEAEALEESIRRRQAEMAALEQRIAEAEVERQELERMSREKARLEADMGELHREAATLGREAAALREEKASVESAMVSLRNQKLELERATAKLQQDKADLTDRLQGALSRIADTQDTARGLIVNLPDILFALNQAELKPEAKIVIAKIAGILLLMPDLQVRAEGHTDSTGSATYNQQLSEKRADSVLTFLEQQGIDRGRLAAFGYGMDRPLADNATVEGRKKNRRVEIVISRGEG